MAGGGAVSSGNGKAYPGKLTKRVLVTCIVAAMGGLIFGYDLGISGMTMCKLYHIGFSTVRPCAPVKHPLYHAYR